MARLNIHQPEAWWQLAPECHCNARNLAKVAGASKAYLVRCSRESFGLPTQELFNEWRILAAPKVLELEQSVKVASCVLWFKQRSHFSHVFIEYYRVSATEYITLSNDEKEYLKFARRGAWDPRQIDALAVQLVAFYHKMTK